MLEMSDLCCLRKTRIRLEKRWDQSTETVIFKRFLTYHNVAFGRLQVHDIM